MSSSFYTSPTCSSEFRHSSLLSLGRRSNPRTPFPCPSPVHSAVIPSTPTPLFDSTDWDDQSPPAAIRSRALTQPGGNIYLDTPVTETKISQEIIY